jgi:hypothetical protein
VPYFSQATPPVGTSVTARRRIRAFLPAILQIRSCWKYALRIERSYLSGELPKLDMMTVNQLFCLLKGDCIIRAFERS